MRVEQLYNSIIQQYESIISEDQHTLESTTEATIAFLPYVARRDEKGARRKENDAGKLQNAKNTPLYRQILTSFLAYCSPDFETGHFIFRSSTPRFAELCGPERVPTLALFSGTRK